MFDSAEIGLEVNKADFEKRAAKLRVDLVNAQFDLKQNKFSVLILIDGDDRWGAEEVVDRLNEWLDARELQTEVLHTPTQEELARPRFWRYWRNLPRHGQIGLFLGAWPRNTIADRMTDAITRKQYERRIEYARSFEQMLAEDRTVIFKFWMHMPKKDHRKRLKKIQSDSDAQGFAESIDWTIFDNYDEAMPLIEDYIQKTDAPHAPWRIIESTDRRHRDLAVAESILHTIRRRIDHIPAPKKRNGTLPKIEIPDLLSRMDLSRTIQRDEYKKELSTHQTRLVRLARKAADKNISPVVVFEGWDAAGKGGAIRRITQALQARLYRVWAISAPDDRDLSHHYLWRFWTRLPRGGKLAIFDRSWYGRVLVERVEGFAKPPEWRRAFAEINDFEQQLVEHGWPVIKFWLHIDPDEQLRRFEERRKTPYKKYKITDEDYRNRERWNDYVEAANEMFARTHTEHAPWHLIAANDKRQARIDVLQVVADQIEQAIKK